MSLIPRLLLGIALGLYCQLSFSHDSGSPQLPLGSVLNDKGQPMHIPNEATSHFNYSPAATQHSAVTSRPQYPSFNKAPPSKKQSAKKSRKQQLASRNRIANDPSCRWLDNRMTSLERNLSAGVNSRNNHYQQELNHRQQEWQCMKCGAEGPEQADYAACQYRR